MDAKIRVWSGVYRSQLGGSLTIIPFLGVVYHCYSGKGKMNCEELKGSLLGWFGSEIECQSSANGSLIATLPLLRVNGDAIEIGVSPLPEGRWRMSDLGQTHEMFFLADLDLREDYVRAEEFNQIIISHGLKDAEQEISSEIAAEQLADQIFDFAHALQAISGLQFTAKPRTVARDFNTVVALFFAEQRASIEIPSEPIPGLGGSWKFDFALNHVSRETLVKTISTVGKNLIVTLAEKATFEIGDVKKLRDSDAVVIGDDYGKERQSLWRPDVLRLFKEYQVPFYAFEHDNDALTELAQKYSIKEI
jgi:hypothetical protein